MNSTLGSVVPLAMFSDITFCSVSLDLDILFVQIQTVGYAATGFFPVLLTDPCVHAL